MRRNGSSRQADWNGAKWAPGGHFNPGGAISRQPDQLSPGHAAHNSSHAWIALEAADGTVSLEVEDDGGGISPEDIAKGRSLGLKGMRERVTYFGGSFEVGRAPRGGTRVHLRVPVPPKVAQ